MISSMVLWGEFSGFSHYDVKFNEVCIWDDVETPSSYGARSNFITASNIYGYNNTDVGVANVRAGSTYINAGVTKTGTLAVPAASDVRAGTSVDATTGTLAVPSAANVRSGVAVDATTGTCVVPAASNVRSGTPVDATTGTCVVPAASAVLLGTAVDATTGTLTSTDPGQGNVVDGVPYEINSVSKTGSYVPPASVDPGIDNVRSGTVYEIAGASKTGTCVVPSPSDVRLETPVDATTGTLTSTDPGVGNVVLGTAYEINSVEKTGTLDLGLVAAKALPSLKCRLRNQSELKARLMHQN